MGRQFFDLFQTAQHSPAGVLSRSLFGLRYSISSRLTSKARAKRIAISTENCRRSVSYMEIKNLSDSYLLRELDLV